MKDSEILRMVAARIAEDHNNPVNINMTFTTIAIENPDIRDRTVKLRDWVFKMRNFCSAQSWLKLRDFDPSIVRVWTVCWLRSLIDLCIEDENNLKEIT